jgi:hypothetical protein
MDHATDVIGPERCGFGSFKTRGRTRVFGARTGILNDLNDCERFFQVEI